MSTSTTSWLDLQANETFRKSRNEFLQVYVPLTDVRYKKEKVWDCSKGEKSYLVTGEGKKQVITREEITISKGKYSKSFDSLRSQNHDSSPKTIDMFRNVLDELKTMKKLEEDLLGKENGQ